MLQRRQISGIVGAPFTNAAREALACGKPAALLLSHACGRRWHSHHGRPKRERGHQARKPSVGNAVAFVLLGQLISMAAIDQFGLLGAPTHAITLQRSVGFILMSVGVFMAVRRA